MSRRGTRRGRGAVAHPAVAGLAQANAVLAKNGLPPVKVETSGGDPFSGKRTVDIKIVAPGNIQFGRLSNPDPVLRQFGGWEGVCLYERMERQNGYYAGAVNLFADRVCAIDRTWKAGDESEGKSREMRDKTVTLYRNIPDLHILNKKMVKGRMLGFAMTGKADWQVDEETGVYAPRDLYDIPARYIKFGPKGEVYRTTDRSTMGDLIPDSFPRRNGGDGHGDFIFFRWGSRFTPYGEGDAQLCYLPNWYMQTTRQFGMTALEILGRPIPWAEVPMTLVGEDYDKFELGLKAQYKYYVITRTNTNNTTISFPTSPILANKSAGGSELEFLKWYLGEIYVCVLGVQMTQDSSGGSRALESTRLEVISDKTPPASQALDQAWTQGYSNHIWEVNEPNAPKALYPRCESDASSAATALSGSQLTAVTNVGAALAANQMTAKFAIKTLMGAGLPESWAREMVMSTIEERESLAKSPQPRDVRPFEAMDAADKNETNAAKGDLLAFMTDDGVMREVHRGALVMTDKGEIPAELLHAASGAEIVTRRIAK